VSALITSAGKVSGFFRLSGEASFRNFGTAAMAVSTVASLDAHGGETR
jgi:hypothetical protein